MKIENIVKRLNENLSQLVEMQMKAVANLPSEYDKQKEEITNDIAEIMKCVKTGDLTKLNVIQQRYADHNNN